jgi:hypothetical protein
MYMRFKQDLHADSMDKPLHIDFQLTKFRTEFNL